MINISLEIRVEYKDAGEQAFTLNPGETIGEFLDDSADWARLILMVNGKESVLGTFHRSPGEKRWVVSGHLRKVSKAEIKATKKRFMASENKRSRDNLQFFWTVADLKEHFKSAKSDPKNARPAKGMSSSADGMLEYLLSVGYIG